MPVEVHLSARLRDCTSGAAVVSADGATVEDLVRDLGQRHPGILDLLLDDSGLRRYVNVYVNGRDVRFVDGLRTEVCPGDDVTILNLTPGRHP